MNFNEDVKKSLPHQEKFAKDIEMYWNCELRQDIRTIKLKGGDYNPIDYMVIKPQTNKVMGYIELKNRSFNSSQYNSLIIDHSKMVAIREKAKYSSLPVFLGIRFTDIDIYYELNCSHSFPVYHSGRTSQTRNEYDLKEVEYIPFNLFRCFKTNWKERF